MCRNTKERPSKPGTGAVGFIAIKERIGWDEETVKTRYAGCTCRHTFTCRMLYGYWTGGGGCSNETRAELIADTRNVAHDHYSRKRDQHYRVP